MGFFHRSSSASSSKNPQSASNSSYSPSTGQSGSHSSFDDDNVPIVNLTERRLRDWKINSSSGGGDVASPVSGGSATLPRGTAVGGSRGNLGTAGNNVRFDNSTGGGGGGSGPSSTNTTGIPTHNRAGQAGSSSSPNNLILLIERGQWAAATDRARTHDHEVRQLVKLRKTTKNLPPPISTDAAVGGGGGGGVISASSAPGNTGTTSTSGSREGVSSKKSNVQISNVKCKALHHACQKLRSVHTTIYQTRVSGGGSGGIAGPIATDDMRIIIEDDEYIEACKCLLTLIRIHPEACRERESRHGCLPLHLCVFSMCDTPPPPAPPITTSPVTIKSSLASSLVDTVAAAASRGSLEIMNGMKDFFGTTAHPSPLQSSSSPTHLPPSSSSPTQQQTSKQQNHHRTVRSTSSVDSLGNISQMIQEESEHQRALTYHQLNAKKQQRKLLAGGGGGSSIDELDEIHKGMDDMERLLMGLESRYENEEKGGKDKKKKKRLPSITKVWKGGNNNSSSADNNNNNNNNNNDFGGGQIVRATSAIPSTSDAAKSTTTIINAMTPLDCLEEQSRETDSHSTLRESLRFKDVGGSNGSKGSSQWSSSDEKDKIAKATAAARHSMTMCSDKDKHRSNTTTAAAAGVASSSASLEPTYEDLQRRYLQINTARREEYSVQVINALLDAWPKSVKTSSEGGRLPLHMACFGKATVGVMETILNAYPDAARQRNHDGFLPVHIAAHWGVSHPDIAPLLLRAYPDGAVGRNRWERTPIEEALGMAGENGREHQMSLVWSLRRHPTYWIHNDIGTMLLPRNVRVAPWRMVDVADDGEMSQKNDDNVITSRATVGGAVDVDDVGSSEEEDEGVEVRMKVAQSSSALNNNNNTINDPSYIRKLAQSTDLSLLITKDKHWAAAALRCRSHPQEAREVMEVKVRGAYTAKITPLHYACENQPSVEVISTLIKANPAALERRQEPGGQLPLHAACTWGASPDVIQALLTALSSCAEMKDFLSNLPLHCACYSGADTKVIELLLSAYPQSVWPRNHQGSSAVDIVRRLSHRNRKETLHLLERTMSRLLVNAAAVEGDGVEVNDSCLEWV